MLIDASLYNGEVDLLRLRMAELARADRFIVVEGATTFSGRARKVGLPEDIAADPRVRHVVVSDLPVDQGPWACEVRQRNAILLGIDDAPEDAVLLISDVDEIPRASALPAQVPHGACYVFEQDLYNYDWTIRVRGVWRGTRAVTVATARAWHPQRIRSAGGTFIPHGGWHATFFGGPEAIRAKIQAYSHQEYNKPRYTGIPAIERRIAELREPFDRPQFQLDRVPIGPDHPAAVQAAVHTEGHGDA